MNIFNRNKSLDDDDLPGFRERPRPKLPPVEEDIGETVREQFTKAPRKITINERRERLDHLMGDFARYASDARQAAADYVTEHTAMLEELAAEKAKLHEGLQHIDKLEASMPTFGGKDEKTSSDSSAADNGEPSPGQTVPIQPDKRPIPLPPNRR
jgi:hypothetical protein